MQKRIQWINFSISLRCENNDTTTHRIVKVKNIIIRICSNYLCENRQVTKDAKI